MQKSRPVRRNIGSASRLALRTMQSSRRLAAVCNCRHPASGYVQGINDLVTPFLAVFLSPHMEGAVGDETETEFPEEVCSCPMHHLPAVSSSCDVQQAHVALRAQRRWQRPCQVCSPLNII